MSIVISRREKPLDYRGTHGQTHKHVDVEVDKYSSGPLWRFCENGYQATGVAVSVDLFDMMKELVNDPAVVEHYEELRRAK